MPGGGGNSGYVYAVVAVTRPGARWTMLTCQPGFPCYNALMAIHPFPPGAPFSPDAGACPTSAAATASPASPAAPSQVLPKASGMPGQVQ